MLPPTVPLTLGSVVVRRLIDSYAGCVPVAVAYGGGYPGTITSYVVLISGLMCWLSRQLKNGTLLRVGHRYPELTPKTSLNRIHRRLVSGSWFLRNARACRSRCTDAVHRITKISFESLHRLHQGGILKHRIKIPHFRRSYTLSIKGDAVPSTPSENFRLLYNNDECGHGSTSQDVPAAGSSNEGLLPLAELYPRPSVIRRSRLVENSKKGKSSETTKKKANNRRITRNSRSRKRFHAYRW